MPSKKRRDNAPLSLNVFSSRLIRFHYNRVENIRPGCKKKL